MNSVCDTADAATKISLKISAVWDDADAVSDTADTNKTRLSQTMSCKNTLSLTMGHSCRENVYKPYIIESNLKISMKLNAKADQHRRSIFVLNTVYPRISNRIRKNIR